MDKVEVWSVRKRRELLRILGCSTEIIAMWKMKFTHADKERRERRRQLDLNFQLLIAGGEKITDEDTNNGREMQKSEELGAYNFLCSTPMACYLNEKIVLKGEEKGVRKREKYSR